MQISVVNLCKLHSCHEDEGIALPEDCVGDLLSGHEKPRRYDPAGVPKELFNFDRHHTAARTEPAHGGNLPTIGQASLSGFRSGEPHARA